MRGLTKIPYSLILAIKATHASARGNAISPQETTNSAIATRKLTVTNFLCAAKSNNFERPQYQRRGTGGIVS
jgi:hypothetical protein